MAVIDHLPGRPSPRAAGRSAADPAQVPAATPAATPAVGRGRISDTAGAGLPWPVVIYLFCVMVPLAFYAGPLLMTTLRLFLLFATIPLTLLLLLGRYGRLYLFDVLFFLFILWTILALAANNPDMVIEQTGSVGLEFLGGYLVGRAFIRTREQFTALCRALVAIILLAAPFAVYEALTGSPILLQAIRALPGLADPQMLYTEGRWGLDRVEVTFSHPIHFGLFCSIAFSMAFVGLKDVSGTLWRFVSSAAVACIGALALSSGALLAIALQVGLIAWSIMLARVRGRWWYLVALFLLAYVVVDLISNRKPIDVFMSYATFSAHTAYWRRLIFEHGMENVWANPILGIGLKDWVRPDWMGTGSVDNFWLLMAMRYGIPGFVLVTLGYVLGVVRVMRRDYGADVALAHLRRAWVFTFMGLSFTLCTVHVWTNIYSFVFFMFGAGVWLIDAEPRAEARAAGDPQGRDLEEAAPPNARAPRYTRFPVRSRLPA